MQKLLRLLCCALAGATVTNQRTKKTVQTDDNGYYNGYIDFHKKTKN
jgi:hypothetical protein